MPLTDLTAAHIAAQAGLFEPQRGNNGLLRIYNLIGDVTTRGESVITLALNSFPLPNTTVEPVEIRWLNERRKVAGAVNVEDMEVTFKDYVDVPVAHILKTWFEQVYNPVSGRIGLASIYKKPGLIEMFAPNGSASRFWTCVGIWPHAFNAGTIDMSSSEPVMLTMTLAIDKAFAAPGYSPANLIGVKVPLI